MNFEVKLRQIDEIVQELGHWVYNRNQKGLQSDLLIKIGKLLEEYRNIVNENWKLNGYR